MSSDGYRAGDTRLNDALELTECRVCCSNAKQQQLQQQLAIAQRVLKMAALSTSMAHHRVRVMPSLALRCCCDMVQSRLAPQHRQQYDTVCLQAHDCGVVQGGHPSVEEMQQQQPDAAAQPAYDCGLPSEVDAVALLAAKRSAAAAPGTQSQLLDAVLLQLNSVRCNPLSETVPVLLMVSVIVRAARHCSSIRRCSALVSPLGLPRDQTCL